MSLLDYWDTQRPSVKRRKVATDEDQERLSHQKDNTPIEGKELTTIESPGTGIPDIHQLDVQFEKADAPPNSQTELESSLPAIKTDSQAIEEYESSQQQEEGSEPDLQERLQNGGWRKGRSSIYVDAFNLALETVLDEEAHLFSEPEMEVFRQWKDLSYEAQYLYVS